MRKGLVIMKEIKSNKVVCKHVHVGWLVIEKKVVCWKAIIYLEGYLST
jgi:hypothetical protein